MTCTDIFRSIERDIQSNSRCETPLIERIELRRKLFDNGYEPIPALGKAIYIRNWQRVDCTWEWLLQQTKLHEDHINTGLRTGALVGIDIDLRDQQQAEYTREIIEWRCGSSLLGRRGSKGMMLLYRNVDEPIGKIKLVHDYEEMGKKKGQTLVEILGAGQQFISYGIHPNTNRPYEWLEPGYEPLTVPLWDLPAVTVDQLRQTMQDLPELFRHFGYNVQAGEETRRDRVQCEPTAPAVDPAEITDMFLRLVPAAAKRNGNYLNFRCPGCQCADGRAGLLTLRDGGFRFKCFHTGCVYNRPTGWSPGSLIGERTNELYEQMGGNPDELWRKQKRRLPKPGEPWAQLMAEWQAERAATEGK